MEKLDGAGMDTIEVSHVNTPNAAYNNNDIYLMVFQLFQGLSVAQNKYKFTHYDLHTGNFLYVPDRRCSSNYTIWSPTGNKVRVEISNPRFSMKIIDFGLSRMETEKVIINNRVDWSELFVASNGVFDPYYDMLALLGTMREYTREIKDKQGIIRGYQPRVNPAVLANLYSLVLGENIKSGTNINTWIRSKRNLIYPKHGDDYWWRPKEYTRNNRFIQGKNINDVVYGIATLMSKDRHSGRIVSISEERDARARHLLEGSPRRASVRRSFRRYVNTVSRVEEPQSGFWSIAPGRFITAAGKQFGYWKPEDQGTQIGDGISYSFEMEHNIPIYNIRVNPRTALASGYQFIGKCCKIDMIEYMKDKLGFGVTSGYVAHVDDAVTLFNQDPNFILRALEADSWKPQLGGYKSPETKLIVGPQSPYSGPHGIFEPGTIVVTRDGQDLQIWPGNVVNNAESGETRFGAGPIIVKTGENNVPSKYYESIVYDPILLLNIEESDGPIVVFSYWNSRGDTLLSRNVDRSSRNPMSVTYGELAQFALNKGASTAIVLHSSHHGTMNSINGSTSGPIRQLSQMVWRDQNRPDTVYTFSEDLPVENPAPIMLGLVKY